MKAKTPSVTGFLHLYDVNSECDRYVNISMIEEIKAYEHYCTVYMQSGDNFSAPLELLDTLFSKE